MAMTTTMTLNENLTDDDKVTKQKEAKAKSAKKYMDKLKQDECAMNKISMQKMDYYIKNKELIRERERDRYNYNTEARERKKEKSNLYYHNKFDNVPKMRRGRPPKPIDINEPPKIIRPRGRPPKIIKPLTNEEIKEDANTDDV